MPYARVLGIYLMALGAGVCSWLLVPLDNEVAAVEDAIHSTLEARGSKRQAPGAEWFDTTLGEVTSIVDFVQPMARAVTVKN